MKIALGADPSALKLKQAIQRHLEEKGHAVRDFGTTETREVAFYEAAQKACVAVQEGKAERGILLCGSGMGMAIVAGKHSGIIAACVESVFAARMCRAINNANILCLGAMIWGEWMAKEAAEEVNRIDESTRKK